MWGGRMHESMKVWWGLGRRQKYSEEREKDERGQRDACDQNILHTCRNYQRIG